MDALGIEGDFINFLDIKGIVVYPDKSTEDISLEQTAPGKYFCTFKAKDTGPYLVTLFGQSEDQSISPETFGMSIPYPHEYIDLKPNTDLMINLAEITGGEVIDTANTESFAKIFESELKSYKAFTNIWFLLIITALLLLVIDIALRTINLPQDFFKGIASKLSIVKSKKSGDEGTKKNFSYEELTDTIERGKRPIFQYIPCKEEVSLFIPSGLRIIL